MHDTDFDALLTRTLTGYAEGGVAPIDAVAIATAAGRRRTGLGAFAGVLGRPRSRPLGGFVALPQTLRVVIVVALTVMALVAVALVGSRLVRLIQPPIAHDIVITAGSATPCPVPGGGTTSPYQPVAIDVDTGAARPLPVVCEQALLISPDASRAVAFDGRWLVRLDLETGAPTKSLDLAGAEPMLIQWSPRGNYVYWAGQPGGPDPASPGFGAFIGTIDRPAASRLPFIGGIPGQLIWSRDETRVFFDGGEPVGPMVGNGDGAAFRRLTDYGSSVMQPSPDGLLYALAVAKADPGGTPASIDVSLGDGFSPPKPLTRFDGAASVDAVAWLPDESALAAVVTRRTGDTTLPSIGTTDVELLDTQQTGELRSFESRTIRRYALPAIGSPTDRPRYGIKLSPDGRYAAVSRHTITRDPQGLETHREWFVIIRLSDGSILPTQAQRPPELTEGDGWTKAPLSNVFFSPDSRRVVYHVPFSFQVVDLDGTGYRHLGFSEVAPLGWGGQLVWSPGP